MDTAPDSKPSALVRDNDHHHVVVENTASFDSTISENENSDGATIRIVVKRAGSNSEVPCLELSIEEDATVLDLKTLIQDELADESPCLMVPVHRQRLLFSGKMLTDDDLKLVPDLNMKVAGVNYIHLAPLPRNVTPTLRTRLENKQCPSTTVRRRLKTRTSRKQSPYEIPTMRRILQLRREQGEQENAATTLLGRAYSNTPRTPLLNHTSSSALLENRKQTNHYEIPTAMRQLLQLKEDDENARIGLSHNLPPHNNASLLGNGRMAPQSLFPHMMLGNTNNNRNLVFGDAESLVNLSSELQPLCNLIHSNVTQLSSCSSNNNNDQAVIAATEQTILLLDQLSHQSTSLARSLRISLREQQQRQATRELLQDGIRWGNF